MNSNQNDKETRLVRPPIESARCANYGLLHAAFLRKRYPELYQKMQEDGTLKAHLREVETAAIRRYRELCEVLVAEMEKDTVLKSSNRTAWYGKMDALREEANRKVLQEIVYV